MPGIQPVFNTIIPILDVGHAIQLLPTEYIRQIDNPELENLAWEHLINETLVYEPFLSTSKIRVCGRRYSHPMIGDLEDIFHNGLTEVQIMYRP